ncbi:cytochrome P450 52A13 [Diutina catenulata]
MQSEDLIEFATKWYVLLGAAIGVLWVAAEVRKFTYSRKHGCKPPPILHETGIFSLPFILKLVKSKNQGYLVDFIVEIFEAIGCETFILKLFGVPIVCTDDPENIKAVLATQFNDFALGTRHAHFDPLLGDGIFTLDGAGWKHSRQMLRPQFAREQVAHVRSLEPHLQVFAKHIRNKQGNTFDIQELFFRLTMDTATEFLFGDSVHTLYDSTIGDKPPIEFDGRTDFAASFNVAQVYLANRSYTKMFYFFVNNKEFRESVQGVHKFTQFYVQKAIKATPEELEKKSADGYTFLYELAKQTKNAKVIQDQLLNILLAGRDTTAGLLSFTFFELARNPNVAARLREEIYNNFGKGEDADVDAITFESLKRCEYLKWVLNEVLRLYPSVPVNFRDATRTTTLPRGGGKDGQSPIYVGKGTTVAYSVYATHRLEEYYGKDAKEFNPDRWADAKKLGWAYVPFNGGPRICLGQQFALTEASYVVVRLLQMFDHLELRDNRPYPPKKSVHLTMCHQDGVYLQMW